MKFITAQMCGAILLCMVAHLTNKRKSLYTKSARAFRFALYSAILCITFDMASVWWIIYAQYFPDTIVNFFCKAYLIMLITVCFSALNYLLTEVNDQQTVMTLRRVAESILAVSSFLIIISPIERFYNDQFLYTYGIATKITYATAFLFFLSIAICALALKETVSKDRRMAVCIWMGIWIVSSIGLTFLFAELENPVTYIDTETNLYNVKASKNYAEEELQKTGSVYGVCIRLNTLSKSMSSRESKRIIIAIANKLNEFKDPTFRIENYSFLILSKKENVEKNLQEMQKFFLSLEKEIVAFQKVTIKYGVAKEDKIFESVDDLVNAYYYMSKIDEQKNIVYVNAELLNQLKEKETMKKEIVAALQEDRVEVFYQPIYDTKKKMFASAEALVRMRGRDRKIIPPSAFVPLAEESGLIVPLGERIFELACKMINKEQIETLGVKYIEINLSAVQCEHTSLYENFKRIMRQEHVRPEQLNFEITETVQMNMSNALQSTIWRFVEYGVKFSLDDFGTGSSNLDYMANMPVNIVKLDYTMTQGYFTNPKTKMIIEHVIPMIKQMGFEIVCEGVETEEQLHAMEALGVEYIQGYYFSKPLPREEYLEFIKKAHLSRQEEGHAADPHETPVI